MNYRYELDVTNSMHGGTISIREVSEEQLIERLRELDGNFNSLLITPVGKIFHKEFEGGNLLRCPPKKHRRKP